MPKQDPTFANHLIAWYLSNKRAMPWRETKDPYRIWLSEIILQQTRVAQGLPYYQAFVATFPTVFELANASEEAVLKLWQGLGYYSRARNLHATAKKVVSDYNGEFPATYEGLKALKGIGDYTASAIGSISFNLPTAVVDGNVYRVLARVFGIHTPINSTAGIRAFKALASSLLDEERPALFNQALMEFGAIQCTPQNPYCLHCPFHERCYAFQNNAIADLPVKLKKSSVRLRHLHYLFLQSEKGQTKLVQRTGKGIWKGLYEFPLIETAAGEKVTKNTIKDFLNEQKIEVKEISLYNKEAIVHKLSHQHLNTFFWKVAVKTIHENAIPLDTLENYPVPVLIANFIAALDV